MLLHVELACKVEPTNFESIFKEILKDKFYPYEECLKICKQYGQNEACALLAKKIGDYMTSFEILIKVLSDGLQIKPFRKELYYLYFKLQEHAKEEIENELDSQNGDDNNPNNGETASKICVEQVEEDEGQT